MGQSDFWRVILLVTVGGSIGGSLYWTSGYLSKVSKGHADGANDSWNASFWFWMANAFTGIGGAWAALLASLWAKRAPLGSTLEDTLELLATCIVAGYAGNRVLPAVADRLTKDLLEKTLQKTKAAAAEAQQSEVEAKKSSDEAVIARKIAEINAYLASNAPATLRETTANIETLVGILQTTPTRRAAAFALAWLYWKIEQRVAAIEVLRSFVAAKEANKTANDKDTADAYWNLAWYYEEEFTTSGQRSNRDAAVDCMAESLRIKPEYRKDLDDADEFSGVRTDLDARGR
jgi:hypothetical protein